MKTKHSTVVRQACNRKRINAYKGVEAAKVIRGYFDVVRKTMLTGQEFKFPTGIGYGRIVKNRIKVTDRIHTDGHRSEWNYDVQLMGDKIEKFDYEFKPSQRFRKALKKAIQSGKDYLHYGN